MGMRELTLQEVQQVNGGIIPGIYGALFLGARLAANPAVRGAVLTGLKFSGITLSASFLVAMGTKAGNYVMDVVLGEAQEKP